MALTQPQLLAAVADRAESTKADTKRVPDTLEAVVLEELSNAQKVRIGGLVQLTGVPTTSLRGTTLSVSRRSR